MWETFLYLLKQLLILTNIGYLALITFFVSLKLKPVVVRSYMNVGGKKVKWETRA